MWRRISASAGDQRCGADPSTPDHKTLFHRRGARIVELPICFVERRRGASKLSANIVYEGLIEPWRIRRLRHSA